MNCSCCLYEAQEEARVCKACTKDLYLTEPLIEKADQLEQWILPST